MPKYVYRCTDCRSQEERDIPITSLSDGSWLCSCGGIYRKIITGAAVIFKGKGFYSTGG